MTKKAQSGKFLENASCNKLSPVLYPENLSVPLSPRCQVRHVALRFDVVEYLSHDICRKRDLSDKDRQGFGRHQLEISYGAEFRNPRLLLYGDLEKVVFRGIFDTSRNTGSMSRDDHVDETELGGNSIESVIFARVVENDVNIVVTDMALFVREQILLSFGYWPIRHKMRRVEDGLG